MGHDQPIDGCSWHVRFLPFSSRIRQRRGTTSRAPQALSMSAIMRRTSCRSTVFPC
jgi:hypothetical protein